MYEVSRNLENNFILTGPHHHVKRLSEPVLSSCACRSLVGARPELGLLSTNFMKLLVQSVLCKSDHKFNFSSLFDNT